MGRVGVAADGVAGAANGGEVVELRRPFGFLGSDDARADLRRSVECALGDL
jgi:hypothetical protein